MLDLGLLCRDGLNKVPLLLKVSVSDQFRMVHLDQLKLLCGLKFLLDQILSLSSMRRFDLTDLSQESFFSFGNLPRTHLFDLISQVEHVLGMVRLQLLFVIFQIFYLLLKPF